MYALALEELAPQGVELNHTALDTALIWVQRRVLPGAESLPAIESAIALLAAVFTSDPEAMDDDARVPNMVRLMILPWSQ